MSNEFFLVITTSVIVIHFFDLIFGLWTHDFPETDHTDVFFDFLFLALEGVNAFVGYAVVSGAEKAGFWLGLRLAKAWELGLTFHYTSAIRHSRFGSFAPEPNDVLAKASVTLHHSVVEDA